MPLYILRNIENIPNIQNTYSILISFHKVTSFLNNKLFLYSVRWWSNGYDFGLPRVKIGDLRISAFAKTAGYPGSNSFRSGMIEKRSFESPGQRIFSIIQSIEQVLLI